MSDFWNNDVYDLFGRSADAIMNDIQAMLDALYTNFAGTTQPSNGTFGTLWYQNTGVAATSGMRYQNFSGLWYAILTGSTSLKMWVHANVAGEGWVVDSTIVDAVIALRGGGNWQYKTTGGGAVDKDWQISGLYDNYGSGHTHGLTGTSHNHQFYDGTNAIDSTRGFNSAGAEINISVAADDRSWGLSVNGLSPASADSCSLDLYTDKVAATGNADSAAITITSQSTWRPKAAVGTMQYPNSPN